MKNVLHTSLKREKILCTPQQKVARVLYAIENVNLSFMPKFAFFHVLYVISVSLTVRKMDVVSRPHMSVGEGKIPYFLTATPPRASPRPTSRGGRRASSASAAALRLYNAALSSDSPIPLSLHHYLRPGTSRSRRRW
jgi:hypothetical protein